MRRFPWRVRALALAVPILSGCVHSGASSSGTYPTLDEYSGGTSKVVSSFTSALQNRDKTALAALCAPDYTLSPASRQAAPAFVSAAKLKVERFLPASDADGAHAAKAVAGARQPAGGAQAASGAPAEAAPAAAPPVTPAEGDGASAQPATLTGEQARAYLLERRQKFAGIVHNESRITSIQRHGGRCTVHVHSVCAGVDATEARMQEESWWTWTLARKEGGADEWAITSAVEDRRTLVTAPGPIFRQVYPEDGGDAPWKPETSRTPALGPGAVPGELVGGGVAVVHDCVARGTCLLVGGGPGVAALTRGNPSDEGSFTDMAPVLYLKPETGESESILTGDFNNDGMVDLFVTYQDGPCRLYLGRRYLEDVGQGEDSHRIEHVGFEDATEAAGLGGLVGSFRTAIGFDADRDGKLDLYLVQYGDPSKGAPSADGGNGLPNRFFHNTTEPGSPITFVDESQSSGLANTGWGLSAASADFDGDGKTDVYVANAFGPHALYRNMTEPHGPIRFVDVSKSVGLNDDALGMGVAWGDYDGDGDMDLFVSGYWFDESWIVKDSRFPLSGSSAKKRLARKFEGNALFRNDFKQSGRFVRVSDAAGVADGGCAWGASWTDVDGDGRLDLAIANGLVTGSATASNEVTFWNQISGAASALSKEIGSTDFLKTGITGPQSDRLFLNLGDGTFAEVGWTAGFDTNADLRGLIATDITGDGAPDLIASSYADAPVIFENTNMANVGHATIQLNATDSNWDAVGAIVRVKAGDMTQVREMSAGGSFLSDAGRLLTFGLAPVNNVDGIEVDWPSGRKSKVDHPSMNRRGVIEITEPPPPGIAAPPPSDP